MVRPTTLIHGVMGSNLVVVTVSAPQIRGLDDGASGIGQAKSRPTKSDMHPGKFHCANYCSMGPCTLKPPVFKARTK